MKAKELRIKTAAEQLKAEVNALGKRNFSFTEAGINPPKKPDDNPEIYYFNCLQAVWNIADVFTKFNPEDLVNKKEERNLLDRQYKYLSHYDLESALIRRVGTLVINDRNASLGEALLTFLNFFTKDKKVQQGRGPLVPIIYSSKNLYTIRDILKERLKLYKSPQEIPNKTPRHNAHLAKHTERGEGEAEVKTVVLDENLTKLHTLIAGIKIFRESLTSPTIPNLETLQALFQFSENSTEWKRLKTIHSNATPQKRNFLTPKPSKLFKAFKKDLDNLISAKLLSSKNDLLNISTEFHKKIENMLEEKRSDSLTTEKSKIEATYQAIKETSTNYDALVVDLVSLKVEKHKVLTANRSVLNGKQSIVEEQYKQFKQRVSQNLSVQNNRFLELRIKFFGDDNNFGLGKKAREYLVKGRKRYCVYDFFQNLTNCCRGKNVVDANGKLIPTTDAEERQDYLERFRENLKKDPGNETLIRDTIKEGRKYHSRNKEQGMQGLLNEIEKDYNAIMPLKP